MQTSPQNRIARLTEFVEKDDLRRIGPQLQKVAEGKLLWNWLSENFLFFSSERWLEEITLGRITVNQRIEKDPHRILKLGDQLGRVHPLSEEPEVNTSIEIVWQDDQIAVISKPAGLPMHEAALFRRKTVHWILPRLLKGDWHAAHRLDRETSGILICAKGTKLREQLAKSFERGEVEKTYLAVCDGVSHLTHWTDERSVILPKSAHDKARCAVTEEEINVALSAKTECSVLKTSQNKSWVQAIPRTGRTHQIRVHLASIGLPLCGDKVYGRNTKAFELYLKDGNTDEVKRLAGMPHHLLHAWKVKFIHPVTKETIFVTANPPEIFEL